LIEQRGFIVIFPNMYIMHFDQIHPPLPPLISSPNGGLINNGVVTLLLAVEGQLGYTDRNY
jgi:hypothetical protein